MASSVSSAAVAASDREVKVLIIGGGFSGLAMVNELKKMGYTAANALVVEKSDGVGGTWRANRYPGCACDIQSYFYSFDSRVNPELQQEWSWTHKYAEQPEILKYAEWVTDKLKLRDYILFHVEVVSCNYNEQTHKWVVGCDVRIPATGTTAGVVSKMTVHAERVVLATGPLSTPKDPKIPGREKFKGLTIFSQNWPAQWQEHLSGKTVGVIGTGSTASQLIPEVAKVAKTLIVFQRSPAYVAPRSNAKTDPNYERELKKNYDQMRLYTYIANSGWAGGNAALAETQKGPKLYDAWTSLLIDPTTDAVVTDVSVVVYKPNDVIAERLRSRVRETIVDLVTAEALCAHYPPQCKRLIVSDDYLPTFNRDNVKLVDTKGVGVEAVTEAGVMANGKEHPVDVLVFATGFDALTLGLHFPVVGKQGVLLKNKFQHGPRTYLGLGSHGFPNLFFMVGPQSPSVLANMTDAITEHAVYLGQLFKHMDDLSFKTCEASQECEDGWVKHHNDFNKGTIVTHCNSWYRVGGSVPGVPGEVGVLPYVAGATAYTAALKERALKEWGFAS